MIILKLLKDGRGMMQLPGHGGGLPVDFGGMDYSQMSEEQKKTIPPDKLKSILRKIILIGRLAETV